MQCGVKCVCGPAGSPVSRSEMARKRWRQCFLPPRTGVCEQGPRQMKFAGCEQGPPQRGGPAGSPVSRSEMARMVLRGKGGVCEEGPRQMKFAGCEQGTPQRGGPAACPFSRSEMARIVLRAKDMARRFWMIGVRKTPGDPSGSPGVLNASGVKIDVFLHQHAKKCGTLFGLFCGRPGRGNQRRHVPTTGSARCRRILSPPWAGRRRCPAGRGPPTRRLPAGRTASGTQNPSCAIPGG